MVILFKKISVTILNQVDIIKCSTVNKEDNFNNLKKMTEKPFEQQKLTKFKKPTFSKKPLPPPPPPPAIVQVDNFSKNTFEQSSTMNIEKPIKAQRRLNFETPTEKPIFEKRKSEHKPLPPPPPPSTTVGVSSPSTNEERLPLDGLTIEDESLNTLLSMNDLPYDMVNNCYIQELYLLQFIYILKGFYSKILIFY